MNVLVLTNNSVSQPLLMYLQKIGERVTVSDKKLTSAVLPKIHPDFIISYNYRYIISEEIIKRYPNKIINLHSSYLPWNRGSNPNFWSFVEGTPKGVTIHFIDRGLDTGNILGQKEITFDEERETLETTYAKLHGEMLTLFKSLWERIKTQSVPSITQSALHQSGSYHSVADFRKIMYILGNEGWKIPIATLRKRYEEKKY